MARDFSDGHSPSHGGPTKTSRALAITHLAARDAYAMVLALPTFPAKLAGLPVKPPTLTSNDANGQSAAIGAGLRAMAILYPDFGAYIAAKGAALTASADMTAVTYGADIADKWIASRQADGSALPQLDSMYHKAPGHHRSDPMNPAQTTLGRTWGQVKPFILNDVVTDAPLAPPPGLTTNDYGKSFDQVYENGRDNITERNQTFREKAEIGIFWGYDGANKLGTPPRLYNQVVVAAPEFIALNAKDQLNVLAAINAAMADAGIAAWYWKYFYDFWRPVVGIREADAGWGPTGLGDGNTHRAKQGNPFWRPLGAPRSNPAPVLPGVAGANSTPNFPAYPSGHATFGTACFVTFAKLINKPLNNIKVTFVSDEFTGKTGDDFNPGTTDNQGMLRPRWEATFTLEKAIEDNKVSRIYLGVHWDFDADGGEKVGKLIADKAFLAFK